MWPKVNRLISRDLQDPNLKTINYISSVILGGNCSALPRQAYIINCRPADMVAEERKQNYDHGLAGLESIEKKLEN